METIDFADAKLEKQIANCRLLLEQTKSEEVRKWTAKRLVQLIAQRSPEQVKKMEAERGLSGR